MPYLANKQETLGPGGGGVSHTDEAAFTTGTDQMVPVGGIYDEAAPGNLAENQAGVVRLSVNRAMHTVIRDGDGNERSLAVNASGGIAVTAYSVAVSATPTITAGAYAAKDAVGGLLTFANAARTAGGVITIMSIALTDLGNQSASLVLVLFDRTFTATADNAAFDPSDADLANCVGHVPISASDYQSFADNAAATVRNVGLQITLNGTSLFGQLMCLGTPTYGSTADLTVRLGLIRD